jgi:hypothetical protein
VILGIFKIDIANRNANWYDSGLEIRAIHHHQYFLQRNQICASSRCKGTSGGGN